MVSRGSHDSPPFRLCRTDRYWVQRPPALPEHSPVRPSHLQTPFVRSRRRTTRPLCQWGLSTHSAHSSRFPMIAPGLPVPGQLSHAEVRGFKPGQAQATYTTCHTNLRVQVCPEGCGIDEWCSTRLPDMVNGGELCRLCGADLYCFQPPQALPEHSYPPTVSIINMTSVAPPDSVRAFASPHDSTIVSVRSLDALGSFNLPFSYDRPWPEIGLCPVS
jgi:hypothetical protein